MAFNLVDKAIYQLDVVGQASTQTVANVYHYSPTLAIPGTDYTSNDFLNEWETLVGAPFLAFIGSNYQGAILRLREIVAVNPNADPGKAGTPVYGLGDQSASWPNVVGTRAFPYLPTYVASTIKFRGENSGKFKNGSKRIGPLVELQTEGTGSPNELTAAEVALFSQLAGNIESKIPSGVEPTNDMRYGIFSLLEAGNNGLPLFDWFYTVQASVAFRVLGSQVSRKRLRTLANS